ncbi:14274_t:CDS:2, partial [Gigaspora rosea]
SKTAIAIGTRWHNNIYDKKDTLRGSLSDKTNIGSSSRSSSKEHSKPSKSFNLGSKPKHRGALTLLIGTLVELMDMDETKLPASDLIQNTPYYNSEASITTQIEIDKVWESFEEGLFLLQREISNTG